MIFVPRTSMFFLLKWSSLCQLYSSENFGELAYTVANLHTQNHFKVWILFKFSSDFLSEIRGALKFALVHGRSILQNAECLWSLVTRVTIDQ